ncbi:Obg-like ATPase 1 [Hondaea fermentalgiana]|uniref:Obg-like ATPase 1 n=1 Tax=Hondaea fermentalgiana TaxID=2315210 RepID=A0A2R5GVD5_9STRA|nr:Obg-like ATPase 1 [Hondaea fermentalgiana]|eukprot:GBG34810.1 Obg-like ATPase 1 [Hondaea fermentalgiana]
MAAAGEGLLRVLCLHGSSQTKEILRARLGWLPKKVRKTADLVFVDAPHELPLREGDSVPTRTWWRHQADEEEKTRTLQESFVMLEKVWKEQGPFDGIIGFSMGGAAAARIAANPSRFPGLEFVILGGAPCMTSMASFWQDAELAEMSTPSLHIMGRTDRVVDLSSSKELAARFVDAQIYEHDQGHLIPSNAPARNLIVDFLNAQHERIMASSAALATSSPPPPPSPPSPSKAAEMQQQASKSNEPPPPPTCTSDEGAAEQRDEVEALESIYPDTMKIIRPAASGAGAPCGALAFRLACEDSPLHQKLELVVDYPANYPEEVPRVHIEHSLGMLQFPQRVETALLQHVRAELDEQAGMPCVYTAISAAETWLEDPQNIALLDKARGESDAKAKAAAAAKSGKEDEDAAEDEEEDDMLPGTRRIWEEEPEESVENELVEKATKEACIEVARRQKNPVEDAGHVAKGRGVKKFVVGLVGKPSAGKSTLFCCTTRLQTLAKVAAHPFTTIEPNYGVGWWASNDVTDEATDPSDAAFETEHGRDGQGRRLLPLLIKDVAGLIPGAYKGQGKGNKFLNDLCDADVLIHVVDVSGSSDRNGVAVMDDVQSASTAEEDIKWVREELHRWIFGNVVAKWRGVVRAARARNSEHAAEDRLVALLTGYQGPTRSIVTAAAARSKLDPMIAERWSRADLHRFIAHFLSVRFPMCLALNKCDRLILNPRFDQEVGLEKLEQAKKVALEQGYVAVPCSAMLETNLLSLAGEGKIEYAFGSSAFAAPGYLQESVSSSTTDNKEAKLRKELQAARKVMDLFGSTGVVDCISSAVALREPTLVYPVTDLKSGKRRECLQSLPGSTVDDIFSALKHGVVDSFRLEGDFIRAEGTTRTPDGATRLVGKNAVMDSSIQVLRILTNRKVAWQHTIKPKSGQ